MKIPERRADGAYFQEVAAALQERFPRAEVAVNPLTASVLCTGGDCGLEAVDEAGRERGLFALAGLKEQVPPARKIQRSFQSANASIRRASENQLDLPTLLFFFLVGTAVYQIGRGRFGLPPWYTAFWYAFGLFTKWLLDAEAAADPQHTETY